MTRRGAEVVTMGQRWGSAWWWLTVVVVVGGAACHDVESTRTVRPQAVVEGAPLDFGEVPVGEWREASLVVRNIGFTAVNLREVLGLENNPSFEVEYEGGELQAQHSRRLTVRFHPLQEGPLEEHYRVEAGTDAPMEMVRVQGRGIPTRIEAFPSALDFETLEIDSSRTLPLTITNPVDLPLTVRVAGVSGSRFSTETLEIAPHATVELSTRYLPPLPGEDAAALEVSSCPTCTPTRIPLTGRAVESAFQFDPAPVPFEATPLHSSSDSMTTATNITWRPVRLAGATTSDEAFEAQGIQTGQEIGPGQSLSIPMRFSARASGPTVGHLALGYTSDRPRESEVFLDANGGRPTLALAPAALDLGDVPVGGKIQQEVRLSNAGTIGNLELLGLYAEGDVAAFGVRPLLFQGQQTPWIGAWPTLELPPVALPPGAPSASLMVFFEPTEPGTFNATIHLRTDDPFTPTRALTVTGRAYEVGTCEWQVLPTPMIDFGNVPPGWGAALGFSFRNTGEEVCAVKDIELANDGGGAFFMPGGAVTGGVVPPGTGFSAMVAFRAPQPGTFEGALTMTVNDPATPNPVLPLVGDSAISCLTASPNFLDFGPVRYDCAPPPRRTLISNQCPTPIRVEGVRIGPGTSEQFSLVEEPSTPIDLAPGEGFEVEAAYARNVHGQHYSPLFVRAEGEPTDFLIPLLAETNHDDFADETFVQGEHALLDVLFVVSNTTTMTGPQGKLAAAIPGWVAAARAAGISLQVGVTSTALIPRTGVCRDGVAGGHAGRLVPVDAARPRITDDPATLQQNVRVGVCHDLVQGLEAMRQAITPPLITSMDDPRTPERNDGNRGLLRDAARLAVVMLADEDDHSGFDPESYVQLLQSLKGPGGAHRTRMHALLPQGGCTTATPSAPRFEAVARATGGRVGNICDASYESLLMELINESGTPQQAFVLTHPPSSEEDIQVLVDGVESTTWTWDAAQGAIVFPAEAIPAPGQRIRVRYRSECGVVPPRG